VATRNHPNRFASSNSGWSFCKPTLIPFLSSPISQLDSGSRRRKMELEFLDHLSRLVVGARDLHKSDWGFYVQLTKSQRKDFTSLVISRIFGTSGSCSPASSVFSWVMPFWKISPCWVVLAFATALAKSTALGTQHLGSTVTSHIARTGSK
jgi:hypothetical protein